MFFAILIAIVIATFVIIGLRNHILYYILKLLFNVYYRLNNSFRQLSDYNIMRTMSMIEHASELNNGSLFKFEKIKYNASDDFPTKRSGHRAVFNDYDNNLYIWGGFCPVENNSTRASPCYPELWQYNVATSQWFLLETTGDVPDKTVASHAVVIFANNLIVYGGTGYPFGNDLSNSLYSCNLKTLVWKRLDTRGEPPLALYGSSLILKDNYLYILFGTTSREYFSNVYQVNLSTLESVKLFDSARVLESASFIEREALLNEYPDSFLDGRFRQECILHGDDIYTFGGSMTTGQAYSLEVLPVFNIATNKWRFVQTLPDTNRRRQFPFRRKCHTCVKIDSYVYIFGGVYISIDEQQAPLAALAEKHVWRIDLGSLKWERLKTEQPVVTYFHASAVSETGQVWFHGGVTHNQKQGLATSNSKVIRIPDLFTVKLRLQKLSDICWEYLLKTYPHILELDKQTLIKLGFPQCYINKIDYTV